MGVERQEPLVDRVRIGGKSCGRTREVTDLPVCVGIGVSNGDQAAAVGGFADGVIVGSALVRTLVEATTPDEGIARLRDLVTDLAAGVRRSRERVTTS